MTNFDGSLVNRRKSVQFWFKRIKICVEIRTFRLVEGIVNEASQGMCRNIFLNGLPTFPIKHQTFWYSIKISFANLHNSLAMKRIIYPLHVITLETHKARCRRNICRSSHFCMTNLHKKSFQRASLRVFANRHKTKTNSLLIETSKDRSFFVSISSSRWINVRRSFWFHRLYDLLHKQFLINLRFESPLTMSDNVIKVWSRIMNAGYLNIHSSNNILGRNASQNHVNNKPGI